MQNNQPRKDDVVLGGQSPPPLQGMVLGGIEGVKHRLKSVNAKERTHVLIDALRYGNEGLDLLVEALSDRSEQVRLFARNLLRERAGERGKQALLRHNPSLLFTTLDDWKFETYSPEIGINTSVCKAYNVHCYDGHSFMDFTLEYLQNFLKEPQVCEVEALVCQTIDTYIPEDYCNELIELLCQSRSRLNNLKSLFICDVGDIFTNAEYNTKSCFDMSEVSLILEKFPNLEVLKLTGLVDLDLCFKPLKHNCLKSLIVEINSISSILEQICNLDLPALEYLKVTKDSNVSCAASILTEQIFPNLYYLGLTSSINTNELMEAISRSPTHNLAVLDLHSGDLTDNGAEILINSPIINQLHTLNIANNFLSEKMIQRFSKLSCQVIAKPQSDPRVRYNPVWE